MERWLCLALRLPVPIQGSAAARRACQWWQLKQAALTSLLCRHAPPLPHRPRHAPARRHRTIPFVCRSWWQQLNDSPQLLQDVALKFVGAQAPVRFRSFCERVLRRGAGGMRRLKLNLDLENAYSELAAQEMGATLALLLGACGAAGSLEELRLKEAVGASTCWLAAMRRLRQLHIEVCYSVDVDEIWLTFDSPSWCLAGLEELSLDADRVKLAPTAHLPCTLTRLYISGLEGGELPIQVRPAPLCGEVARMGLSRAKWV